MPLRTTKDGDFMKIGTYEIQCIFETSAYLSSFKGSALRGAFGHSLKRSCCALKHQDCQTCLLATSCAYSYIFETHKYMTDSGRSHMASRPHPYVLAPQVDNDKFEPGESFSFNLLLLGERANEMMPYVIYAISRMGQSGLGRGSRNGAGRFSLNNVFQNGKQIYTKDQAEFTPQPTLENINFAEESRESCSNLVVHFQTPLRMKSQGRFVRKMTFEQLTRGALRRLSALEECYGNGYPQLDYKGLIQSAAKVSSDLSKTRWQENIRYSNRQKQKMNFGGVAGSASFHGDLGDFLPLLRFGEKVHLGKQTTFGLGKISLEQKA